MRRDVPQFIDIEDKIIGPLSFKQAIYVAGGVGAAWSIFAILSKVTLDIPFLIKAILAVPFLGAGLALAFLQMNKRPLVLYLESFFKYQLNPKQFIWRKNEKKTVVRNRVNVNSKNSAPIGVNEDLVPRITRSKIKDLSLTLDMDLDSKLSGFNK